MTKHPHSPRVSPGCVQEVVLAESDEEEEYIYNPLKLPLGWDGKPIPYWLYKLHGLNMEFKCEICGNASYWGRRAFERHFKVGRRYAGRQAGMLTRPLRLRHGPQPALVPLPFANSCRSGGTRMA